MGYNKRQNNNSSRSGGRGRRYRKRSPEGRSDPQNQATSTAEGHYEGNGDPVTGVLDIVSEGFGFLRSENTFEIGPNDAFVPVAQIRNMRLRAGMLVTGNVRAPKKREKPPTLHSIEQIEGEDPQLATSLPLMHDLTPLVPDERFRLEYEPDALGTRIVDLLVPVGKGQRGVIVAPPKAGKTMLLQEIARALTANYPELPLFILLIDERPEEVTDFRSMKCGKVVASSFDSTPQNHLHAAELTIARCIRLVEGGKDVFMLLDSLTRLTRTSNVATRGTGRSLSGGLDPAALLLPRKLLGAARNIEGGGSLTILATALVETDSRMDEVIFEEFKGTGNWELKLDRKLADRRIFPAFDLSLSGTRREELLYTHDENEAVLHLRRSLLDSAVSPQSQMEQIRRLLDKHKTNDGIVEELLSLIR